MDWIFVAVLAGSIVTSGHSTEEQCLGRKAVIERDNKIIGTCIKAPSYSTGLILNGTCINCVTVPN